MDAQFYESTSQPTSSGETNQELFTRHNDSVLCCSIDNNTRLAVSGGIDDTAFVWDLKTKHVIFECLGHKESVVAAAFSANSTYVATGDLSGYIQVRNTTTGIKVFDYDIDEINWILWHNTSEFILLAGTTRGDFWMWNVNDPAAIKTFPSYGTSSTTAKLLPDGMKIVVAYQDGFVRIFDLKTKQTVAQSSYPNRSEIISMDLCPSKTLIAVGCIDSSVKLMTIGSCKVIGILNCNSSDKAKKSDDSAGAKDGEPMEQSDMNEGESFAGDEAAITSDDAEPIEVIDEYSTSAPDTNDNDDDSSEEEEDEELEDGEEQTDSESVESLLFSPCGTFLAASNNSGSIYIWDVATQVTRCELHTGIGITRCAWSKKGNYVTGCLDGAVRIYNINLEKLQEIFAHRDQILDMAYRENALVTASEDKTCRVMTLG